MRLRFLVGSGFDEYKSETLLGTINKTHTPPIQADGLRPTGPSPPDLVRANIKGYGECVLPPAILHAMSVLHGGPHTNINHSTHTQGILSPWGGGGIYLG